MPSGPGATWRFTRTEHFSLHISVSVGFYLLRLEQHEGFRKKSVNHRKGHLWNLWSRNQSTFIRMVILLFMKNHHCQHRHHTEVERDILELSIMEGLPDGGITPIHMLYICIARITKGLILLHVECFLSESGFWMMMTSTELY